MPTDPGPGPEEWPAACSGLVVVDVTQGMAGPMATMILADHGATVVKIEPPEGDWARTLAGFQMWNRGKRSKVLDLSASTAAADLHQLASRADVLVDSFSEETAARLGIDEITEQHPSLIRCGISGFGPAAAAVGPIAGYDAVVSAAVGRMSETDPLHGAVPGQDRAWPIYTAAPVVSYGAAQLAVQGILAALRRRGGRGRHIRTSLAEAWVAFMMRHELARGARSSTDEAAGRAFARGVQLCYMAAECADGRYVQMCARQDHHFRNWLEALGLDWVLTEPRFAGAPIGIADAEAANELEARLRAAMRTRTRADWMEMFTETWDVGADPFLTPQEFLTHPQMLANDRVVTIDDPILGTVHQLGPLVAMADTPARIGTPAPRLGEFSDAKLPSRTDAPAGTGEASPGLPLAGVTVVEAAYFVAGPLAGALLAELGARVIKLEPPDGDPFRRAGLQSVKFLHGKESIAVDLKHPEGREILRRLVRLGDVFVHSFRATAAERLGLDHSTLTALNPRLVYLNASSYGSRGPQRHRAAFHSTPNALAGGGISQAGAGNPPVDDSYADPGSALAAATAILLGLTARDRTGRGQYLETSMLTSAGYILSNDLVRYADAPAWRIPDAGQHGVHALYRLYPCGRGWLMLAVVTEEQWTTFAHMLGHPEWLADPALATPGARLSANERLTSLIQRELETRPAGEWCELLGGRGLGVVEVDGRGSPEWLAEHDLLEPAEHPAFGAYWRLPPKLRISGARTARGAAATVGEHTRSLLREVGYAEHEIDRLVDDGTVAQRSGSDRM